MVSMSNLFHITFISSSKRQCSNCISGGGCTKDADGNLVLLKDQDADSSMVSSIINSKEANVPVGLITGRAFSSSNAAVDS